VTFNNSQFSLSFDLSDYGGLWFKCVACIDSTKVWERREQKKKRDKKRIEEKRREGGKEIEEERESGEDNFLFFLYSILHSSFGSTQALTGLLTTLTFISLTFFVRLLCLFALFVCFAWDFYYIYLFLLFVFLFFIFCFWYWIEIAISKGPAFPWIMSFPVLDKIFFLPLLYFIVVVFVLYHHTTLHFHSTTELEIIALY
jgi:hypothetical protein